MVRKRPQSRKSQPVIGGRTDAYLSFFSWLVLAAAILLNPYAHYAGPSFTPSPLPGPAAFLLAALGLWGLVRSFRRLPDPARSPASLDRPAAWTLLVLILAAGAWMRLCHFGRPLGPYWGDNGMEIIDALNMLEYSEYKVLLLPGAREPAYAYIALPFLAFLPKMPLFKVQQLVSTAIDLGTVWLLYLTGRELGDRRTGLLAAALGALGRTLVMKALLGLRFITLPFAVSLCLLFFLRTLKKPDRAHFLQWAAALAFGAYTFTSFRAFLPFMTLAMFLFILGEKKERAAARATAWFFAAVLAGVGVLSIWSTGFFGMQDRVWDLAAPGPLAAMTLAALSLVFLASRLRRLATPQGLLKEWVFAVLLSLLLSAPILFQGWTINHVAAQNLGVKAGTGNLSLPALGLLLSGIGRTVSTIFFGGEDTTDYSVSGDAFLNFPMTALFVLGLVFLLTRPSRKVWFLLLCVPVGAAAHYLSYEYHSGKLLGALPPILLVAAWGSVRAWDAFASRVPWKSGGFLPPLVAVLLIGWGALADQRRTYEEWAFSGEHRMIDVLVAEQAEKDIGSCSVFLAADSRFGTNPQAQQALQDGRGVRRLQETNRLVLRPGERPRDVVLLYQEKDRDLVERIRREFPGASWSEAYRGEVLTPDNFLPLQPVLVGRVLIGWDQVPAGPGKLFEKVLAPGTGWVRTSFEPRCGLARGLVSDEDWILTLDDARPPGPGWRPVRYCGRFDVGHDGKARFTTGASKNFIRLKVDGREVLDVRPCGREQGGSGTLGLSAGVHDAELTVLFRGEDSLPPLMLEVGRGSPRFPLH